MSAVDVHGLPAKWRGEAEGWLPAGVSPLTYHACADELESALRQSGGAVYQLEEDDGGWSDTGKPTFDWWMQIGTRKCRVLYTTPPATSGLVEALRGLMEVTEPPEANCSCHIAPPCGDCVDYAAVREAHEVAHAALAAHDAGGGR